MNAENYEKAQKIVLNRKDVKDFIDYIANVLRENCTENADFRPFASLYIEKLPALDLSRLESLIIINEIRDMFEDSNGNCSKAIDSFIDDIYTRHTGDYPITGVIKFKNEPEDWKALTEYLYSEEWLNDTSWKKNDE